MSLNKNLNRDLMPKFGNLCQIPSRNKVPQTCSCFCYLHFSSLLISFFHFTKRIAKDNIQDQFRTSGFILATFCMWYPHAVSFFRNKIPYSLLKPTKSHAFFGGCTISNALNWENMGAKVNNCVLLRDFLAHFFVIMHVFPSFVE